MGQWASLNPLFTPYSTSFLSVPALMTGLCCCSPKSTVPSNKVPGRTAPSCLQGLPPEPSQGSWLMSQPASASVTSATATQLTLNLSMGLTIPPGSLYEQPGGLLSRCDFLIPAIYKICSNFSRYLLVFPLLLCICCPFCCLFFVFTSLPFFARGAQH